MNIIHNIKSYINLNSIKIKLSMRILKKQFNN